MAGLHDQRPKIKEHAFGSPTSSSSSIKGDKRILCDKGVSILHGFRLPYFARVLPRYLFWCITPRHSQRCFCQIGRGISSTDRECHSPLYKRNKGQNSKGRFHFCIPVAPGYARQCGRGSYSCSLRRKGPLARHFPEHCHVMSRQCFARKKIASPQADTSAYAQRFHRMLVRKYAIFDVNKLCFSCVFNILFPLLYGFTPAQLQPVCRRPPFSDCILTGFNHRHSHEVNNTMQITSENNTTKSYCPASQISAVSGA